VTGPDRTHYTRPNAAESRPACGAPKRKAPAYYPAATRNEIGLPSQQFDMTYENPVTTNRDEVTCGSCIRQGYGPNGRADL
jgi:hypothetical protein